MKLALIYLASMSLSLAAGALLAQHRGFHVDPQFAAGEWKIEIQTPPCSSTRYNVIPPTESGYPVTIECNEMPVGTR